MAPQKHMYYTGGEKIDLVSSDDENKGEKRTKRKAQWSRSTCQGMWDLSLSQSNSTENLTWELVTTQEASDDETLKDLQMDAHKRREIIKDSPFSDEFMKNIDTDEFG